MELIIGSQHRSAAAHMASEGTSPLSVADTCVSDLAGFLNWLHRANGRPKLDTSSDDIIIGHYNGLGIETKRTTISCDPNDREELLRALATALSTV